MTTKATAPDYQRLLIGDEQYWATKHGEPQWHLNHAERDAINAALREAARTREQIQQLRERIYTQVSMCSECDAVEQFIDDLDRLLRGD